MRSLRGRLVKTLLLIVGLFPLAVWLTIWVFAHFEGRSLTWYEALLFLAETMTTTGYGELVPFRSAVTVLFSLSVMVLGFLGIFVYLTTMAGEWLSSRFQELPPTQAPERLQEHVVICGYTALVEALLIELQADHRPFVVLDPNPEHVLRLRRTGVKAILADPTTASGLAAGNLHSARALVADMDDSANAAVLLQAHQLRPDLLLVGTVEHRGHEKFLRYAGAQKVVSPKEMTGRRMARWVISPAPEALMRIRAGQIPGLALMHIFIAPHSPLEGVTLRNASLREEHHVSVMAVWHRGRVILAPGPDEVLAAGAVISVVGSPESLEELHRLSGTQRRIRFGRTRDGAGGETAPEICLIAGFGDVSCGVVRGLTGALLDVRVIGLTPPPGNFTFFHGDATDEEVLRQAGLEEASTFVVALNDDTTSIFTTLVARQINPDVRIVARANHLESVANLYMAGADYVLSVPEMAGTALAHILLGPSGRRALTPEAILTERPVSAALLGSTLVQAGIGSRTGCTVVAVRRNGSVYPAPAPDFALQQGDELVLFGTEGQLASFAAAFGPGGGGFRQGARSHGAG